MHSFILNATLAGIGIALITGPLGCFVVWRRMAYFGDSLAHSALLGIAIGLLTGLNINISIVAVCATFALLLVWLQQQRILAADTLMGILAHAALSAGMLAISFLSAQNFDLHSYLFGDILTVSTEDLLWIYGGGAAVISILIAIWPQLVLLTLHEDLAKAEGINNTLMHLLLVLLMTIVVSVSIRLVGILLITSLLIIPAASARQWVKTPENMAILAAIIGVCSVILGIGASAKFDVPSGPAIVVAAAVIFAIFSPLSALSKRNKF